MLRQIGILIVLAGLGATACGDDSTAIPLAAPGTTAESSGTTEPGSPSTTPVETTPPTNGTEPSNEAGFGQPARYPGEFPATGGSAMTGVLRLLANGCFMLEFGSEQRVVAFPEGFVTDPADPTTVIGTDGSIIVDGTAIDATGQLMGIGSIPGGRDSRWGNQLGFCDHGGIELAVLDTAVPAFDPAALSTEELVGLMSDAEFTESWACGFGFAASTADQRVGVVIYANTPDGPSGAATVVLPDERWDARVIVGKNLFAQSCDDVFEFWEPESIVAASWPIVAGSFELDAPATSEGCGGSRVSTTLNAAIVDTPSGQEMLPTLELTNAAWGCFAG